LVRLTRWDNNTPTTLDQRVASAAHSGGVANALELSCAGSTIQGFVNGERAVSAQDSRYHQGTLWIGVPAPVPPGTAEARFDNLAVEQR
jgi:hypothetical protein